MGVGVVVSDEDVASGCEDPTIFMFAGTVVASKFSSEGRFLLFDRVFV